MIQALRRRKRWLLLPALLTALTLLPSTAHAQSSRERAREIIDRVDRMMRGESSHARIEMQIRTEHWARELEMEAWSVGTDHSLVRVTAPPREEGTATLKAGQEVWNYLPRVDRTIKVPPSLMMGSWMGSHFTNDDLVKDSRIIEDYDFDIAFEGVRDAVEVWEFVLVPKPEAPVVWGRIEEEVRQADLMPTWVRYYDEGGELVRTMTFSDFRVMDDRLVPARMEVVPSDAPDEYTRLIYHELDFDVRLDEEFFSLRNLRSRR